MLTAMQTVQNRFPEIVWSQFDMTTSATPGTAEAYSGQFAATGLTQVAGAAIFNAGAAAVNALHLKVGQQIQVSGATPEAFNGRFAVTGSSLSLGVYLINFTIEKYAGLAASASGTIVAAYTPMAQRAIWLADSANTDPVFIGPDATASYYPIAPGESYLLEAPKGYAFDLRRWYAKSAAASQALRVLYV